MSKPIVSIVAVVASIVSVVALSAGALVDYPEGYRDWTHAKSMVIHADHPLANPFEGIHHVYVNKKAQAGMKRGEYHTGAAFVFDLLNYADDGNAGTEGARKFIGVMEFDARRFASTGGWGFEAFAGDSKTERVVTDGGTSCFGCHVAMKDKGYVFTEYRE